MSGEWQETSGEWPGRPACEPLRFPSLVARHSPLPKPLPSQDQRIGSESIGQFHKRHLCLEPVWIFGNAVHGFQRVIANQVNALANHQERLEARALSLPGKFKVADG